MGKPDMWKAVDATGQVHFTDNPAKLPPALRQKAERVQEDEGAVTSLELGPPDTTAKAGAGVAEPSRFGAHERMIEGGGAAAILALAIFAARSKNPTTRLLGKVGALAAVGALGHVAYGALGVSPQTMREQAEAAVKTQEATMEKRDQAIEQLTGDRRTKR